MSQTHKVIVGVLIILAAGYIGLQERQQTPPPTLPDATSEHTGDDQIRRAYRQRANDVQVRGSGEVVRLLADDLDGSRHQRFIVRLTSGHTVLIAHNIDLAPRIDLLDAGDRIAFSGVYEWNERGGVVHWTHHDPQGRRQGGWIEHQGRRYR
ncbi:MAG: DUF3465 domain-containing protein [Candidatus Thiodiazotropha sp.]